MSFDPHAGRGLPPWHEDWRGTVAPGRIWYPPRTCLEPWVIAVRDMMAGIDGPGRKIRYFLGPSIACRFLAYSSHHVSLLLWYNLTYTPGSITSPVRPVCGVIKSPPSRTFHYSLYFDSSGLYEVCSGNVTYKLARGYCCVDPPILISSERL